MSDERIFLSHNFVALCIVFSIPYTYSDLCDTDTYKGKLSSERNCLFKLFEGLCTCLIKYVYIKDICCMKEMHFEFVNYEIP